MFTAIHESQLGYFDVYALSCLFV